MNKMVEILPDKSALIERSLDIVLSKMQAAIQESDRCTIALAGGGTPKPLYEAIATHDLPWEKIHIFWGDERYVPPDDPDSNQRMARRAWLDKVAIPPANIHPMPTDGSSPEADAVKHEAQLREFFGTDAGEFPQFDVILLGIGDDAHTASLFPQTEALSVRDRLVTVGNKDGQPRITLTVPLINQAGCVLFLVAGASKRSALAQIFASEADPLVYPARFIQPQGELWWLLDGEAGQDMKS
ncbi:MULTISPECIES: 6-phosphogluconolactonase [unclassified Coleofasciculus]|uniref:6-phosphogluconolactonase n=1 Tax=unclassified Coleofasciculus TaxID=2692782 RepID=UPI0018828357|nr:MULTISPECIES: 6-phosphogluconolactonase [unclassified Coleofasciculus]MBE9125661.1 6-phosphogluconolactonase [Coleofasciculus sp. LEGE 07081]MBE9148816.1 6-phosphogluconolactonase [Coleofasciculus sp. LEGE 07092]